MTKIRWVAASLCLQAKIANVCGSIVSCDLGKDLTYKLQDRMMLEN